MPENSLAPAFVKIDYSSAYGAHTMTVPSVPVDMSFSGGGSVGFDLRGAALSVNADTAIKAYIDVIKPFFNASVNFASYTIYAQADETASPLPVQSESIGVVGTHTGTGWNKATQATFTWRADDFGLFKIVLLDFQTNNDFNRFTGLGGATLALHNYVTADVSWLSSRSGGRPNTFLQLSQTLNEALRKRYGLT